MIPIQVTTNTDTTQNTPRPGNATFTPSPLLTSFQLFHKSPPTTRQYFIASRRFASFAPLVTFPNHPFSRALHPHESNTRPRPPIDTFSPSPFASKVAMYHHFPPSFVAVLGPCCHAKFLQQVRTELSERLYRCFGRQVRLVVHRGAVMARVLQPSLYHRESTQDVDYIHVSFASEYRARLPQLTNNDCMWRFPCPSSYVLSLSLNAGPQADGLNYACTFPFFIVTSHLPPHVRSKSTLRRRSATKRDAANDNEDFTRAVHFSGSVFHERTHANASNSPYLLLSIQDHSSQSQAESSFTDGSDVLFSLYCDKAAE